MNLRKLSKKNASTKKSSDESNTNDSKNSLLKDTQVQNISQFLASTKITIIGGGGIAATELPKLSRELRRHGAEIHFCVTENCLKFIGMESLRWASGNEVVINPSGLAEHICTSDALVISPATADIISKSSNGICSDGATTLIQSALGMGKTIIFCPTMHESLSFSPIIEENKEKLKRMEGVFFTRPRNEEGKEKLPLPEILSINIAHIINKRKLYSSKGKRTLVTLGGTRTMLDPVRCITNLSTGSLGIEVAKTFYAMGIDLTLLCANTNKTVPIYDNEEIISLPNYQDMYDYLKDINENKFDGIIHLVAGSDFAPRSISHSKISSKQESLRIDLVKTKKIIDLEHLAKIPFKAAAKLTSGSQEEGIGVAKEMLNKKNLNSLLYSNSSSAWDKNPEHSGIFLKNTNGQINEICVNGKKEMAVQFYLSFKDYIDKKKDKKS
jgi:phosphopantothenoylcysteine decarboxylase / phosphopantothenate---cysteine ligase